MAKETSPTRVADGRQPLLVPLPRRDEAKGMGAIWHPDCKIWSVPIERASEMPRCYLPIRDRPGLEPPFLVINLVPQTSWGRNMRALMPKADWHAFARSTIYALTGSVCLVCGGRGPEWPVEADEVWRYNDDKGIQTLHKVVPLCPACHEVRTCGLAVANGRANQVAEHLAWVERIPKAKAKRRIDKALAKWERRSQRSWTIDMSAAERKYGIRLVHDHALTDDVNRRLVRESRRRAGYDDDGSISLDDALAIMTGGYSRHFRI